jgi:uncharacterized protein (DUF58 family)
MYTFLVFALGLVAIQTGLNAVFLCTALVAGMLMCSPVMCGLTARGVQVTRKTEERVFAGDAFPLRVVLHNTKKWMPAVGLRVAKEDENGEEQPLARIPGQAYDVARFHHTFPRRGYHTLPGIRVRSQFPLGLTELSVSFRTWNEVLVLPRLGQVHMEALVHHFEQAREWEGGARRKAQRGTFRELRPYRPGDSLWRIHWQTSARKDDLYVKEYEERAHRRVLILLDAYVDPAEGETRFDILDRKVSFAASLARRLEDMDMPYGLTSRCPGRIFFAPATGPGHLHNIWEALAVAELPQKRRPKELTRDVSDRGWKSGGVVVVTGGAERSFPSLPEDSIIIDVQSATFNEIFSYPTD